MRALVEDGEIVLGRLAVAHAVEDAQERLVVLTEHALELDQRRPGAFHQGGHLEEERAAVRAFEMLGHLGALHHRRQLMQIAEQDQPHAAERLRAGARG